MCSSYVWRSLGLRELEDRKAWFRRNPEIPGESLRIIPRGFERFDKSGKRFDLLALDKQKGDPGRTLADPRTTRRAAFSSTFVRKSPC